MWAFFCDLLLRPELIAIVWPIFVSGFDVNSFLLRVVLIPKSNIFPVNWMISGWHDTDTTIHTNTHTVRRDGWFPSLFFLPPFLRTRNLTRVYVRPFFMYLGRRIKNSIALRPSLQAAQKSEFVSFGGSISYPRRGSIFLLGGCFYKACLTQKNRTPRIAPPPTMSLVRTKRQKKDATTPIKPPPAPMIATPYPTI
jgi:hypothetical protein